MPLTFQEVRHWARRCGVTASEFQEAYDGAFLHVVSRLLQALYRESRITRLSQDRRGHWQLKIGALHAPASGPLPFRRIEIIDSPTMSEKKLHTVDAFLAALQRGLARSSYNRLFPALRKDFKNSVTNVVFNRLMGKSLSNCAIEPAYQGHQYYPFPALRIGPTLSQILECSHLCHKPVDLPLLQIDGLVSVAFRDYKAWSGLENEPGLPIHPWHIQLSSVARKFLTKIVRNKIEMIPLASQRTCRIVKTGFDVKLPIDATITGERRLLYRLNCENAPVISALAKRLSNDMIDFQEDIASIFHPEFAPHLSAIIRSPIMIQPGESVIPAINLWAGRCEARKLLRTVDVEKFFYRYCRALMTGPIQYCTQWGMAFEPHLQNVYVAIRDGFPSRIILRDLDASILDARRVRPMLGNLKLAHETWQAMPTFEIGGKRLIQAMLFGHLGEVMWCLNPHIKMDRLVSIVEDAWSDLLAHAPSASVRRSIQKLRGWSNDVKATLQTRLTRSTNIEFL